MTLQLKQTLVGVTVTLAIGCSAQSDVNPSDVDSVREEVNTITVDTRRSLAVTEQTILARFSLQRVLTQLAAQSGVAGVTALQLFQQWWDTQNPGPGSYAGAHCDDQIDPALGTVINGYPYLCRYGAEGTQASCDPFAA